MAPTVLNGDPSIRAIRMDAYEYSQLRAKRDKLALHCPEGGEVHMPNGSIVPVPANGWIIEQPDGTVQVLADELVRAEYDVVGDVPKGQGLEDANAAHEAVQAARNPEPVANPEPEQPTIAEIQADAPSAPGVPPIPGANRDFQQTDPETGEPLTPQRKAEIAAQFRAHAEQAAAALAEAAGKAQAAGLITEHEAAAWRLTGEPPAGVNAVVSNDGQIVVSRAPADQSGATSGAESTVEEGTPVADLPTGQLDRSIPDHEEELQERAAAGDPHAQAIVDPEAPRPDTPSGDIVAEGGPAQDAPAESAPAEPAPSEPDGSQVEGAPPA